MKNAVDAKHNIEFAADFIRQLRSAERVCVLTGAGISAESGVPTFRDAQTGLWAKYRPEDLATPQAFRKNPRLVWEWYAWRRELVANAQPNPGHYALVELEQRFPRFDLITQNVDGLHLRAGSGRRYPIIELHGNIQRTRCFEENEPVETWDPSSGIPPRCPRCGGMLRPDVVWFGEALPPAALEAAWEASQACQVFFSIGTSGLVEPAASLPHNALQAGAMVVEVNPDRTPLTSFATYVLKGFSGEILPAMVNAVWG